MRVHSHFRDRKDLDQTRIKADEDALTEVVFTQSTLLLIPFKMITPNSSISQAGKLQQTLLD